MSNMQAILNPASVAVVGASNDPAKLTGRPTWVSCWSARTG